MVRLHHAEMSYRRSIAMYYMKVVGVTIYVNSHVLQIIYFLVYSTIHIVFGKNDEQNHALQ